METRDMETRERAVVLADLRERRAELNRVEAEIVERVELEETLNDDIRRLQLELDRAEARAAGTPLEGFCGVRKEGDSAIEVFEVNNVSVPSIFDRLVVTKDGLLVEYGSPHAKDEQQSKREAVIFSRGYNRSALIQFGNKISLVAGAYGTEGVKCLVSYAYTEAEVRALLAAA